MRSSHQVILNIVEAADQRGWVVTELDGSSPPFRVRLSRLAIGPAVTIEWDGSVERVTEIVRALPEAKV